MQGLEKVRECLGRVGSGGLEEAEVRETALWTGVLTRVAGSGAERRSSWAEVSSLGGLLDLQSALGRAEALLRLPLASQGLREARDALCAALTGAFVSLASDDVGQLALVSAGLVPRFLRLLRSAARAALRKDPQDAALWPNSLKGPQLRRIGKENGLSQLLWLEPVAEPASVGLAEGPQLDVPEKKVSGQWTVTQPWDPLWAAAIRASDKATVLETLDEVLKGGVGELKRLEGSVSPGTMVVAEGVARGLVLGESEVPEGKAFRLVVRLSLAEGKALGWAVDYGVEVVGRGVRHCPPLLSSVPSPTAQVRRQGLAYALEPDAHRLMLQLCRNLAIRAGNVDALMDAGLLELLGEDAVSWDIRLLLSADLGTVPRLLGQGLVPTLLRELSKHLGDNSDDGLARLRRCLETLSNVCRLQEGRDALTQAKGMAMLAGLGAEIPPGHPLHGHLTFLWAVLTSELHGSDFLDADEKLEDETEAVQAAGNSRLIVAFGERQGDPTKATEAQMSQDLLDWERENPPLSALSLTTQLVGKAERAVLGRKWRGTWAAEDGPETWRVESEWQDLPSVSARYVTQMVCAALNGGRRLHLLFGLEDSVVTGVEVRATARDALRQALVGCLAKTLSPPLAPSAFELHFVPVFGSAEAEEPVAESFVVCLRLRLLSPHFHNAPDCEIWMPDDAADDGLRRLHPNDLRRLVRQRLAHLPTTRSQLPISHDSAPLAAHSGTCSP